MSESSEVIGYDDEKLMLRGLVGERHLALYQNEAEFHAIVTTLAPLLMAWMDTLAQQAGDRQIDRQAEMERLLRLPPITPSLEEGP